MPSLMQNEVRQRLLLMCRQRGSSKSLCPSEVAQSLAPADWPPLMPLVREAAAVLSQEGAVVVTRNGHPVDPLNPGGPIRIRLADQDQQQ